jgi:hypothetical protein
MKVVGVSVVLLGVAAGACSSARVPTASVGITSTTSQSVAAVSTAAPSRPQDLTRFVWSTLPVGPLEPRTDAAVAWSGHELIVWGGSAAGKSGRLLTDGAALDPTAGRWRSLSPTSGLDAREGPAVLWTGREMLVLGGTNVLGGQVSTDGAYDPAHDTWRILPRRPDDLVRLDEHLTAVWTGTGARVIASDGAAADYDPVANRWTSLPRLPEAPDHKALGVWPVWAGDRLLVWVEWVSLVPNSKGIDAWELSPASTRWEAVPPSAEMPNGIDSPLWTGKYVVLPAADLFRGLASGPGPVFGRQGALFDPSNRTYRAVAHGPVDDAVNGNAVWTGTALLRIADQGAATSEIGDAAAWDPLTDQWIALAHAPLTADPEQLRWTGHDLLAYGPDGAHRYGLPAA